MELNSHTVYTVYMNLIFLFQKWRPLINRFEKTIEDFNFGTLLRIDCTKDYSEENSILGKLYVHCIFKILTHTELFYDTTIIIARSYRLTVAILKT